MIKIQNLAIYLLITLTVVMFGCSPAHIKPGLTVDGIIFVNHTTVIVRNIRVQAAQTKTFAYCSHVYPNEKCSTTFQVKEYQGSPIKISWEQDGVTKSTEKLFATRPMEIIEDQPAKAWVVIMEDGNISASLVQ